MTDLNEKALKPCPFCGKDAQIAPDEIGSGGQHVPPYHAGCFRGAGCGIAFTADDPDEAIAEWNRRPLSTITPAEVGGLWVPANPEHAKLGWSYDFEQTERIARAAYDSTGYDATMEVVEFVMAEADRRYATALATERAAHAETKRERDELSDYSFEATKAITGLTVGGSEFFGRKLCDGRYSADLPYCVTHIQDRERRQHETILREGQKRHAATTRLAEVEKALEPFAAAASLIQSQAARIAELEAGLEPFAVRAGMLDGKWLDHETHWSPAYGSTEVTIGHLRAASRLLNGERKG